MIWLPIVGPYADIDVYASIVAYADLLKQLDQPAKTYVPFAPNYSVPDNLRLPEQENSTFDFQLGDQAIILDVSVPAAINSLVPDDQIREIIDHHPGYEAYWQKHIGANKVIIEQIGAVATIVFERYLKSPHSAQISPQIARLLLAAILDNTINFQASNTTPRDHHAASQLAEIASTTVPDFAQQYFSAVSKTILHNLANALTNDCKIIPSPLDHSDLAFAQLALWNTTEISTQYSQIAQIMQHKSPHWIVNILIVSESRNLILTSSSQIANLLRQLLDLAADSYPLKSNRLYLRKEIVHKLSDIVQQSNALRKKPQQKTGAKPKPGNLDRLIS